MSGERSDSRLGQLVGLVVAGLAIAFLILDRTTNLSVPYGYEGSGFRFLMGAAVVVLVVVVVGWKYRNIFFK